MLEKCARKDFTELLTSPKGRIKTIAGAKLGRVISAPFSGVMSERQMLAREILTKGAAYSSEKIETWVDEMLAELLPGAARPIKFHSLILPTYVVATDLAGQRPKVWSTRDTPDDTVGFAVRCSSSIPLFFEPVESGNNFLVDGGMLSNLPGFVFADEHASSLGGRLLAIQLAEPDDPTPEWNIGWLLSRLVSTAISGATNIQSRMLKNTSSISVKTGDISGTDFNLKQQDIDFLIESGRSAVESFVRNEHAELHDRFTAEEAKYSQDEMYDDLVRVMLLPGNRLVVSRNDTRWFWRLFPVIAHWLFSGASIDVVVGPLLGSGDERARELQRRQILRKLGANLTERPNVEMSCFLVCHEDDRHNALFVESISQTHHSPYGIAYEGGYHRTLIGIAKEALDSQIDPARAGKPRLEIRATDPGELIGLLKSGVMQYGHGSVAIGLEEVSIGADALPMAKLIVRRVRTYKYRQIKLLCDLYERFSIDLFEPATIHADNDLVSTITPPVLEAWGDELVVVEGNTRLYHLHRNGINKTHALVARGVTDPLPGMPTALSHVLLATSDVPSSERIENFSYSNFRSIEGAARPIGSQQ
jgi:predicted acylesterase/phospholipase RssA